MDTTTPRSDRTRPRPSWWAVALVQVAGASAAACLLFMAWLHLPEHGLFGAANPPADRRTGALAALAAGPALLSGPLLIGLVRRDGRWLWPATTVALVLGLGAVRVLAGS